MSKDRKNKGFRNKDPRFQKKLQQTKKKLKAYFKKQSIALLKKPL